MKGETTVRAKWFMMGLALILFLSGPLFSQAKIGVFDSQRVSEETEQGKKYQSDLEKSGATKRTGIEAKENEIKDLQDQLAAQRQSLSADKIADMERDIQKKVVELQRLRDDASREFQMELTEIQKKFQDVLISTIEELGKEQSFTLIFEKMQCIYSSSTVDITNQVIEKLNQNYLKKQPQQQVQPQAQQPGKK